MENTAEYRKREVGRHLRSNDEMMESEQPIADVNLAPSESGTTPRDRAAQLKAGDRVGHYQLLLEVARGGMGRVWAARREGDHGFSKLVALKTALGEIATNEEFEKLFLDEARIASRIEHPHVCSILELGDEEGVLYMVLEWIGGGTLHQLMRASSERRLEPRIAARIVAQAASGLHAAHELRDEAGVPLHVIHRDISPQNILLTPDGHAKLADFGVARAKDQIHQATETGAIKGKIWYMAPEQFASTSYDRRADVWALGCVLYEATVGVKPFDAGGSASAATIYQILEARFVAPKDIVPGYPDELESIITTALAKNADDRFATAEDMRQALERWLASSGEPVTDWDVRHVLHERLGPSMGALGKKIQKATAGLKRQGAPSSGYLRAAADLSGGHAPASSGAVNSGPHASSHDIVTPATPPSSRWRTALLVMGIAAAVVAGGAFAKVRHGAASTPPPQEVTKESVPAPAPVPSEAPSAAPSSVHFHLSAAPKTAQLSIDDGPALPLPYDSEMAVDHRPHTLRISAPGHQEERRTVVFSESQSIDVGLAPRTARPVERPVKARTAAAPEQETTPEPAPAKQGRSKKPRRSLDSSDPFGE
jgi:serine/threonine protein kinase